MRLRSCAGGLVVVAAAAALLVAGPARADTPSEPVTGSFVPVTPTRLVDSRAGTGIERRQLAPGSSVTFAAGPTSDAVSPVGAVLLTLTVTNARAGGWVTAFPAGSTRPATSTVNYRAGRAIANSAVVGLGTDRGVALYNGGAVPVDVVVDLDGFYLGGGSLDLPGATRPVSPVRLLDTRDSAASRVLPARQSISVAIRRSPELPAGRIAGVAVNVTASGASGSGSLTVGDGAFAAVPETSTVNYTAGVDTAGLAIAPVDNPQNPLITVRNNGPAAVRVVVDLEAYVVGDPPFESPGTVLPPGGTAPRATTFDTGSAVPPLRVLDTRTGLGTTRVGQVPAWGTVAVALTGNRVVPTGAVAAIVTLTATRATATGHLAVYPGSSAPPSSSTLNYAAAENTANTTIVALDSNGYAQVYNGGGRAVDVVLDVTGFVTGTSTTGAGQVRQGTPADIVVDPASNREVFVSVPETDTVDVYSPDGRFASSYPHQAGPEGLLVRNGTLYVANRESGTVDAFDTHFRSPLGVVTRIPLVRRLAWAGGRLWASSGIAANSTDHPYRLWSVAANGRAVAYDAKPGVPLGDELAGSPTNPSLLYVGSRNGGSFATVSVYDVSSRAPVLLATRGIPGPGVQQLAVSPDGRTLMVAAGESTVALDATTLATVDTGLAVAQATSVTYSPDGALLAVGRSTGTDFGVMTGPNVVLTAPGADTLRLSIGAGGTPWTPPHGIAFDATTSGMYVLTRAVPPFGTSRYLLSRYDLTVQ